LPQKGEFKKKHGLEGKHIVGFLGGLDRIKGLDFLVEAYGQLLKQYKYEDEPILVLAGTDMGFKSELDKLIDEWDISKHVIFTGYISGRDKLEYLVDCDVCVFPSRAEQGLPFAALEAIMCGNSIIVADGTGSAEDVRKMKCGVIVKFGNTKALDDAILMVLSDDMSYLNKRGQDYIYKNLSLEEKARDYERVYADIKGEYYSICR
jgi:glycosyltransferase involved in cell wall biosynthesis